MSCKNKKINESQGGDSVLSPNVQDNCILCFIVQLIHALHPLILGT